MEVDDYSKEPWDKATARSSRRPAFCPKPKQCSMSLRQDGTKTKQEMDSGQSLAEHFKGKQKKELALGENPGASKVATAMEAAWKIFICDIRLPLLSTR